MNTSEYALQMCRPVTARVNTPADGQLGTGRPRRLPPGEPAGRGARGEFGEELREAVGEGEGPPPKASHPEDPSSLAGWMWRRQREGNNSRRGRGGGRVHGGKEDWA